MLKSPTENVALAQVATYMSITEQTDVLFTKQGYIGVYTIICKMQNTRHNIRSVYKRSHMKNGSSSMCLPHTHTNMHDETR